MAKRYINFPKYSLGGVVASSLSIHFIEVLISSFFSVATLGFYALTQRILGLPSSLIGGSIGQVFYQEASIEKHKSGSAIDIYKKTFKKLFILGIIFFGSLYFIAEDLFIIVFGKEWAVAGEYAKVLMPLFFIRFIFVSLSAVYDLFDALKIEFFWQVAYFLGILSLIYFYRDAKFIDFLYAFNIYGVAMYLISLYITYKLAKGSK